jgi:hypothetical protein
MHVPNETWDLDTLAEYVLSGMAKIAQRERKIRQLNRRTAVETHRIGHALALARGQTKPVGRWSKWLKKHGIPTTTAWEAIKLYEAATEEEVSLLTISEAKARFGIYPEFAPQDESDESKTPRQFSEEDAERQLNVLYRRLKGAAEVVTEVHWEQDLLYSTDVDEILQFCRQVVRAINQQRKKVRQPKSENTKRYLAHLRSL